MKIGDHSIPVYRCRRLYVNGAIISHCPGNVLLQHLRALHFSIRIIHLGGFRDYSSSTCMYNELEHISWTADVVSYLSQY